MNATGGGATIFLLGSGGVRWKFLVWLHALGIRLSVKLDFVLNFEKIKAKEFFQLSLRYLSYCNPNSLF